MPKHRVETEELLALAGRTDVPEMVPQILAEAQIRSNLLIAEELRGIREALQGVVTASPSGVGSLRVREQSR